MSAAKRVRLLVAAIVVVVAGTVAGVVLATRQDPSQPAAQCKQRPKALVVPGVPSPNVAAVRRALARPPKTAAQLLEPLSQQFPKDPVVLFNFGTALVCAGYVSDAEQAYRQAKQAGYDTYYEMEADALLHLQYFHPQDGPPYPIFQPQGHDPLLIEGVLLQRRGKQHSAEKLYARAARLHPRSDEAQVAAAVGRFNEDNLSASFSRLGPLVTRFPHSQSVRYHLGLLLAWTGQRDQAIKEFRLSQTLDPRSTLGVQSTTFLRGLTGGGSSSTKR
jgi:tetratricopeptide (TPR) repeat protein